MVRSRVSSYLLSLVLAAAALGPAWAVETGEIQGRVVDESGAALSGVEVRAVGPGLQGERSALSAGDGSFRLPLLPVGRYTLTFKRAGFNPLVQENVVVRLGQVTSLKAVLGLSALEKEVVVTAQAPLIDKTTADTSFTLTAADLQKLPAQNRTVVDAVKFAPGVTGVRVNTRRGLAVEGQPSFRGEGEEGNNWIVDGLSISGVRLRNSGIRLNFDAVDEMQVLSDSFSPEFGSAYGGIINMVTKSGGNALRGELALIFTNKTLQAGRRPQLAVVSEPSRFSNTNAVFNLGGPLVRDKLWFFLSDNVYVDSEETETARFDYLEIPGGAKTTRQNNLFAKLTYALAPNHTLSLTSILRSSLGQSGGTGFPEMFDRDEFGDTALRVNYKGILSATSFLEAGLGFVRRDDLTEPLDGDLGPSMYYIEDLGRNIHNSYGRVTDDQSRFDAGLKLTKSFAVNRLGRHELVAGLEFYDVRSDFTVDFTGQNTDLYPGNGFDAGTKYYFESWREGGRTPTFFYEYGPLSFVNSARGIGLFLKDKISFGPATLMLGLRSQTQSCLDADRGRLWSWGLGDFLSPRATLAWDVGGDGVNIVKLGWGRFSDLITTMPLGLFNSGAGLTFRTHRWQGGTNPDEAALSNPANWRYESEQKSQAFEVADGIKPNFLTRYLVEFDRRIGPAWAAKARFVKADAENLLEILAVFDVRTIYKFLYDNFEHKRRNYWGLEFELEGAVGDALTVNASYGYSSSKGTNPGQTETGSWSQEEGSTNYLGLFGNHLYVMPIPELAALKAWADQALAGLGGRGIGDEGWYGKLPYAVDHNIKLNAAYLAPWGVTVSGAFEWLSGYPWEKLGYVPFFGGYYAYPEGRGSRLSPSHSYLDLGLEKTFGLGSASLVGGGDISLRVDVFNVLNSQQPISFVKESIPVFGSIWARQQPRQARATLRFKW
ncbi:MAG: carboxypeptidase regulatory-like domain-containing protein [Candidatus Aminicenantes bacterium]|nr:carboxypeptidase regulatory-like domain-containing protein [Candidatus Aminicenantes bacterium]